MRQIVLTLLILLLLIGCSTPEDALVTYESATEETGAADESEPTEEPAEADDADAPTATAEPEPTEEPTAEPEPTDEPEPTEEPTAMAEPEPTDEPTPEPEPTAEPVATEEPPADEDTDSDLLDEENQFADETLGFSMTLPEDWSFESMMGLFIIFVSSEEFLEGDEPQDGAAGILIVTPVEESLSLEDTLEEQGDIPDNAEILVGPEAVTIDGRDAIHIVTQYAEDGAEIYTDIYVIEGVNAVYLLTFVTAAEESADFAPLFDEMVSTIEIGEADLNAIGEGMFDELPPVDEIEPPLGEAVDGGTLALNSVATVDVSIPVAFSVDVVAGESYLFATASDADMTMTLTDSAADSITVDNGFSNEPETLFYTAEADDTLTLTVAPFFGGETAVVAFYGATTTTESTLPIEVTDDTLPVVIVAALEEEDSVITVTDVDGNQVARTDRGGIGIGEILILKELEAGGYSAEISSYSGGEAAYTSTVIYIDAAFGAGYTEVDPFTSDVTLPTTTEPLAMNTLVADGSGQVGYTFTAVEETNYVVLATSEEDVVLSLFDADGTLIRTVDDYASGEREVIVVDAAGDYTLLATAFIGELTEFSLALYEVEAISDSTLTFAVTEGETRPAIVAVPDADSDLILKFVDAEGNEVDSIDAGFSGEAELLVADELPAGEYTAEVSFFGNDSEVTLLLIMVDPAFAANE